MKSNNKMAGVGLLTAFAASLCCITPVIALIAGTTGAASTFSWMEPARPYLIGFTLLTLGFAWYQKLKPAKLDDCNCEMKRKPSLMQSKLFLGFITIFAAVMLTFPYYSHLFYSDSSSSIAIIDPLNLEQTEFNIEGMTCESCENHISHEINQIEGIGQSTVSYENGNAIIKFDKTKTTNVEITTAINSTGYTVTNTNKL